MPPHMIQCHLGCYLRTKWHLNPSSHLATTDMDQKLGDMAVCILEGMFTTLLQVKVALGSREDTLNDLQVSQEVTSAVFCYVHVLCYYSIFPKNVLTFKLSVGQNIIFSSCFFFFFFFFFLA